MSGSEHESPQQQPSICPLGGQKLPASCRRRSSLPDTVPPVDRPDVPTDASHTLSLTPCPFLRGCGILKKRKSSLSIKTVRLSLLPSAIIDVAALRSFFVECNCGNAQVVPFHASEHSHIRPVSSSSTQSPFVWPLTQGEVAHVGRSSASVDTSVATTLRANSRAAAECN